MARAIVIHGGAGLSKGGGLTPERQAACEAALGRIVDEAAARLAAGAAAFDVVEAAVCALEDEPLFNAGRGAVLDARGDITLDASIMASDGRCGAVACAKTPRNPIRLARAVAERSPHVLLVGNGADAFAQEVGVELATSAWFETAERRAQWAAWVEGQRAPREDVYGTVGAVAVDARGDLAAATSTGGTVGKRPGRVGDSPIVGAGTWADRRVAVGCTGQGEAFLRARAAGRVAALVELAGLSLAEAAARVIAEVQGQGGLIAVDAEGRVATPFSTAGMFRAFVDGDGRRVVAVW
jgi:beta-aspartyl-peptidase (threonine type)